MDFLDPAIESAFSMSAIVAQQLSNPQMDGRVSRFARYIFGNHVAGLWCNYFRPFKTRRCGLANEYQDPFNRLSEADQNDRSSDIFIYCDLERFQYHTAGDCGLIPNAMKLSRSDLE